MVVPIWNQTVANLTLMALGCAAPEVLLSGIEIVSKKFEAEELGPSETVASAAFNLFVIIGVCIYIIPKGESRRIKNVGVFLVTAVWSMFAYVWLFLITSIISPGVIEVWEAVLTLIFFPVTVLSAYITDRCLPICHYLAKSYKLGFRRGVIVEGESANPQDLVNIS